VVNATAGEKDVLVCGEVIDDKDGGEALSDLALL
jgi:hypothetical protein